MKRLIITILVFLIILLGVIVLVSTVRYNRATERMHELGQELDRKIFQWEQVEFKRPPLYGMPVPGNAAEFYAEAEGKISSTDRDLFMYKISDVFNREQNSLSKDARDFYERSKALTALIRHGVNTETFKSLSDYRTIYAKWPFDYKKTLLLAQMMLLQGRECEEKGDFFSALEWYCSSVRYGIDMGCNGTVTGRLMGIGVTHMSCCEIVTMLNDKELSEEQLMELLRVWEILIDSVPPLDMTIKTEHLATEILLQNSAQSSYLFSGSMSGGNSLSEGILIELRRLWINRTDVVALWEKVNLQYEEIRKISRLTPITKIIAECVRIEKKRRTFSDNDPLDPYLFMPGWPRVMVAIAEYNTHTAGVYILAALQLYKARHGVYPDKLELLVSEIMPDVPLDPFTGKPFIYRTDSQYGMWLYGADKDMVDNGGDYGADIVMFQSENSINGLLMQLRSGKDISGSNIIALAKRGITEAIKDIVPYLKSKRWNSSAVLALSILNAREFVKDIASLLHDESNVSRIAAVSALGIFDAREYSDEIALLLKDKNKKVCGFAGVVLTELGRQEAVDKDTVEEMKRLCREIAKSRSADADVNTGFRNGRERMREALRKLGVPEDEMDDLAGNSKGKK